MKRLFLLLVVGFCFFSKASEPSQIKAEVVKPADEDHALIDVGDDVDGGIVNSSAPSRAKGELFPASAFIRSIKTYPYMPKGVKRLLAQSAFATSGVFRFLKRIMQVSCKSLKDHTGDTYDHVVSASFDGVGDKVVTASADGAARIWSVVTGMCEQVLQGHTDEVISARFNGAGDKVVTASDDGTARIWSVATGECEQVLQGNTGCVWSASFNGTGDKVVTVCDGTARIYSVATGECEQVLRGRNASVRSAVFNGAGDKVVTASSWDGIARIWSVVTGECEQVLQGHADQVNSVSFNETGDKVVSVCDDGIAYIWDIDFLEKFKRVITLEQAFLLNALYEVDRLRGLITRRERNDKVVTDQEGVVLTVDDMLFDFEKYAPLGNNFKEALVQAYADLPQEIRAVFDPYIKPVEVIGQEAL